jgi:hypothetical protein
MVAIYRRCAGSRSWAGRLGFALLAVAASACNLSKPPEDSAARQSSPFSGPPAPAGPIPVAPLPPAHGGGWNLSGPALYAKWNALRGDPYELDAIERRLEASRAPFDCRRDQLIDYAGTTIRYQGAVTISEAFRSRLELFEQVAAEVAAEIYGRAPRRIRHYGAFSCRTSRNRSERLSEHALGNALDVVGFDFGPATKAQIAEHRIPRALQGSMQVRVAKHWGREHNATALQHARFLRELTERLIDRGDVFRGFVGPGHPGHDDHLHFDMSPWRYVRL